MSKRSLVSALLLTCILASRGAIGRADDPRETPLVRAIRRASPAAVNIHSEKTEKPAYTGDSYAPVPKKGRKINGMGTGIIIDERGYIVTNHHVVNGVDSLQVTLDNGSMYSATVISEDPVRDLAILKIQATTPLATMPLGISSDLMLGETVIAVGNAFGYENTVTTGIISALSRNVDVNDTQSYKNLIQTDAAINPGNSGGPLINIKGEMIGINVAIRAGAQKIGFAIPIDDARKVIADLLRIEYFDGTYHGLVTHEIKTPIDRKLIVDSSRPGSPAESAGFKSGDVIAKVGKVTVLDAADFERGLLGHAAGDEVLVLVKRDGKSETVAIKLAAVGNDSLASGSGNVIVHPESDPLSQRIWEVIGIRVSKIQRASAKLVNTTSQYEGGLEVLAIRPASPAAQGGMRQHDVVVGLDKWQTIKMEDVSWILEHRVADAPPPLRFHVVRSNAIFFGDMTLDGHAH